MPTKYDALSVFVWKPLKNTEAGFVAEAKAEFSQEGISIL
jgi:hypothetical protein